MYDSATSNGSIWPDWLRGPQNPPDQDSLQRQPCPEQPLRYGCAGNLNVVNRHVDVGWEYRQQQEDETPGGRAPEARRQQPKSSSYLCDAAYIHQKAGRGKVGRDDLREGSGLDKMQDSGPGKEQRKNKKRDPPDQVGSLYVMYFRGPLR